MFKCLDFQATLPKDKSISHEIPMCLLESVGADIFIINSKHYICIEDYYSKFTVIKHVKGLSTDNIIQISKVIFGEQRLPSKIISDTGTNFI